MLAIGIAILVALVLVLGVAKFGGSSSGPGTANLPPAGSIWFGTSWNPSTFEVSGQRTSFGVSENFSFVAHLTRSLSASELAMRIYWNGSLVQTVPITVKGSGDVWGFTPGPLFEPGVWKWEMIDIGGNVLASGSVTATK